MPSINFVAPAFAEMISSIHARSGSKARGQSLSISCLKASVQVISRVPLLAAATLALFGTLVAPLSAAADSPRVTLSTTQGDIVLELDEARAPQTVKNFLAYVDSGFYDDTLFHRVIEGFMIQGGGFNQSYQKKPTRAPVSNEAYNGLRNRHYTIAMARTTAPHSATSQFFINSQDNSNLDHTATTQRGWGYTVFGRVVEGQDIVDAISRVSTGPGGPFSRDVPAEPVIILSATRTQQPDQAAARAADDNNQNNSTSTTSSKTTLSESLAESESEPPAESDPLQPTEQN